MQLTIANNKPLLAQQAVQLGLAANVDKVGHLLNVLWCCIRLADFDSV